MTFLGPKGIIKQNRMEFIMRLGQRRAELIYHQLRKLEKYLLEAFCTQANIDYHN